MGMVKQLWSISGLAVELDRDRRTIAKALGAVPPDGQINGHDAWFLQTALTALGQTGSTSNPASLPTGFELLDQVQDPLHQGTLATLLSLVYSIGPIVAECAVAGGAEMKVAWALHHMMISHFTAETEEFARSIGIDPHPNAARAGIFNLGALQATDWKTLAEMAGEPVDLRAWQDWSSERIKQEHPGGVATSA